MSLDAGFLKFLTVQFNNELKGGRVDKINMPSRDEVVLTFRASAKKKLFINASTNCSHILLADDSFENPAVPPAFCMLLRKHFLSAKLLGVKMPQFERCIVFEFECKNDFFEPVNKEIIVELTGRSTNLILTEGGKIIDALRRIDLSEKSGRCILPTAKYSPPSNQSDKTPFTELLDVTGIFENGELTFEKAIMQKVSGISPLVARELAYRSAKMSDMRIKQLGKSDMQRLTEQIQSIQAMLQSGQCEPTVIIEKQSGRLVDFCFLKPTVYTDYCTLKTFDTPSQAVFEFYKASTDKMRLDQKTKDLYKFITRTSARIERTMQVRKKELDDSKKAEKYRLYGELINANLYRIEKGQTRLIAQNYYDDCNEITIPLKAELSGPMNAAAYFKKYTKAKNSAQILATLIEKDRAELSYFESVFLALCSIENLSDAEQIRKELQEGGYLKRRSKIKVSEKPTAPRKFEKDGFIILVGRNNLQNDYITVKMSRKNDIWLHTKSVHSSHVLISLCGKAPKNSVVEFAARLCAYYSSAKDDTKVEVDYCPVQNVKKPAQAKPGMVVYDGYQTVVVKPFTEEEINGINN